MLDVSLTLCILYHHLLFVCLVYHLVLTTQTPCRRIRIDHRIVAGSTIGCYGGLSNLYNVGGLVIPKKGICPGRIWRSDLKQTELP
ncbi:MAG: hypothetical protein DRH12_08405 [Deltaproteobacteria bacterium]|nr:MAG: hypothetical protein DRH12_08405 [Deltaproteobacteria bacterium]